MRCLIIGLGYRRAKLLALLWLPLFSPDVILAQGKQPNIVLIVIDDLGYCDLPVYGNTLHETPHIDKLAAEGMMLTDFHSNGAVCSPTRAALMTGQYQQRSKIEQAIGFNTSEGMPIEKVTIADILAAEGYQCGVFGKWHLGHINEFGPNHQGFKRSVVSNNTPDYHTHISRIGEADWYQDHSPIAEKGYLTDLVTSHSVSFIEKNHKDPFFLFISHLALHFPFQGPKDPSHRTPGKMWHDEKFGPLPREQFKRAYKDMLERVDESVGEVVKMLDKLKLRDNTLIIVTSDNGAYDWVGSNYPYRGQKGDLFEGGHRIPAIFNWPGKIGNGKVSDATTMTMDLAPTLTSIAGITLSESGLFDGIDLSQVLFDQNDPPERSLFWRFITPDKSTYAVRKNNWKYVAVNNEKYLFNLKTDPTEKNDLKTYYPSVTAELEREYQKWSDETSQNPRN